VIVAALFTLGTLGTSAAVVATEGAPAADAAATLTEETRKATANFSIVTAISLSAPSLARWPAASVDIIATRHSFELDTGGKAGKLR
jgi:hypothetical protein